jgi:hypothetical protein
MTETTPEISPLDLREKLIRIDQMLADIDRTFADRDRKRQEIQFAPWVFILGGITTCAALLAAGAALMKLAS